MKLTDNFNREQFEFAWWVEIMTNHPICTYYFGPFADPQEAQYSLPGYVEDLEQEEAREIQFQIKLCQPKELTILR